MYFIVSVFTGSGTFDLGIIYPKGYLNDKKLTNIFDFRCFKEVILAIFSGIEFSDGQIS